MSAHAPATSDGHRSIVEAPLIEGSQRLDALGARIIGLPMSPFRRRWRVALAAAGAVASCGAAAAAWLLYRGVGVWGVNVPTAWGFAIVNFVWWIGIGHAGTLISAILLVLRQPWRNSINRFAEAMTLFAVLNAGLFPLLHLGRVWKFFYLLPYPNQMGTWPQWRSPLVWDAFAVSTYALVSVLFWYLGLIPDLGALRDRARSPLARRLAALAALGWCGEAAQWEALRRGYLILAGLATALVVSVHSIVSLDFAVSVVPGWNATIFPPYFVAGAIFSGMAMVLTITIPLRAILGLRDIVTLHHLDLMAKVMLANGLIVAYGYFTECMTELFSPDRVEQYRLHARLGGHGAAVFWTTVACNVVVAQSLWFKAIRLRPARLFLVTLVINVGMWLERFDIVVTSLERDYLPSSWRPYVPTLFDWGLLAGTLGLFAFLFLLFVRLLPISAVYEISELAHEEGRLDSSALESAPPALHGRGAFVAEFDAPNRCESAVGALRSGGYTRLRVYSPMPLRRLGDLGASRRPLAGAFLAGGIVGGLGGYLLQVYSAAYDYPWLVGGKPLHAWPSFIPITYEMVILGAALAGFVATLLACRLPRLYHPVFDLPGFHRALESRFFVTAVAPGGEDAARVLAPFTPVRVTAITEAAA